MSDVVKPRVVTLCGSTRFPQAFDLLNAHLSMQGDIVISCGLFGHTDTPQGSKFLTSDGNESTQEKVRLDELHKRKIDLADCIYVVNLGGYIGSSTKSEIEYAHAMGKPIYFMFPPANGFCHGWIVDKWFYQTRNDADIAYRVSETKAEYQPVTGWLGMNGESINSPYPDEISTERDPETKLRIANGEV